jgi:hypothetical protein
MPSIPALPAAGPSFAERLSSDRPQTSSTAAPIHIPRRETSYEDASAVFHRPQQPQQSQQQQQQVLSHPQPLNSHANPSFTHSRRSGRRSNSPNDRPLAPPLPLVLRPPLRKKKSFSRVSSWLFPGSEGLHHHNGSLGHHQQQQQHGREMSFESVTNVPRPVTGRDGFYQTFAAPAIRDEDKRSLSSLSTWDSSRSGSDNDDDDDDDEDEDDDDQDNMSEEDESRRTVPTSTWSPGSSPATKQGTPTQTFAGERSTAFFGGPALGAPATAGSALAVGEQPRVSRIGLAA